MAQWYCGRLLICFPQGFPGSIPGPGALPSWHFYEMYVIDTELLGMRDNITQNDLLIDETRSLIEKKLEKSERENQLLKERMEALEKQLEKVISLVEKVEMLSKSCT